MKCNGDSDINPDLGETMSDIDISDIYKERRNIKRWFFLTAVVTVLMLTAATWKLMKPDMSTYDGTALLIMFLIIGFWIVLSMLAFVLLKLKHILMWMEDLQEAIEWLDQKTAAARYDTPDDDIFSGD